MFKIIHTYEEELFKILLLIYKFRTEFIHYIVLVIVCSLSLCSWLCSCLCPIMCETMQCTLLLLYV